MTVTQLRQELSCFKNQRKSGRHDTSLMQSFALLDVRWLLCAVRCNCFDDPMRNVSEFVPNALDGG